MENVQQNAQHDSSSSHPPNPPVSIPIQLDLQENAQNSREEERSTDVSISSPSIVVVAAEAEARGAETQVGIVDSNGTASGDGVGNGDPVASLGENDRSVPDDPLLPKSSDDLKAMQLKELKPMAKRLRITGFSKKNKVELMKSIAETLKIDIPQDFEDQVNSFRYGNESKSIRRSRMVAVHNASGGGDRSAVVPDSVLQKETHFTFVLDQVMANSLLFVCFSKPLSLTNFQYYRHKNTENFMTKK